MTMNKNVSIQEAHIRTLISVILILLALFIIDNQILRILFAVVAAVLAATAFFHTCPFYTLTKKDSSEQTPEVQVTPEASTVPMPDKPIVGMEEESTPTPTEDIAEEKKV